MKRVLQSFAVIIAILVLGVAAHHLMTPSTSEHAATQATKKSQKKATPVEINWREPSEKKAYPNWKKLKNPWVDVSIKNQRVYIKDGSKTVYTMYASTGVKNSTPRGTYHIQTERGKFFYNAQSKEGAKYWVSFKDHGIYLFHTVPTDKNGHYNVKEADKLGKAAHSHGCVRLGVPDAKWFYHNVSYGTKVVIA
ncbi:L,D-transpeptidase [Secundilactobacillus folii]|uniref:L,D-transpeptidase family protein n=1 Tax=Secundilactobacillus folii TaxID=2678357 RepID=A0A7X2XUU8_9LACO|nr:L,D-transpeptidase [Secundilactobacillus folii]MTV82103.1 L,D-transpeptidase family protein [Secundilactobacillus folii]